MDDLHFLSDAELEERRYLIGRQAQRLLRRLVEIEAEMADRRAGLGEITAAD